MLAQGHMTGYWPALEPGPPDSQAFNSFSCCKKLGAIWPSGPGKPRVTVHVRAGPRGLGTSLMVSASAKVAGGEGWLEGPGGHIGDKLSAASLLWLTRRNREGSMMVEGKQSPFLMKPLLHGVPPATHTHTVHPCLAAETSYLHPPSQDVCQCPQPHYFVEPGIPFTA